MKGLSLFLLSAVLTACSFGFPRPDARDVPSEKKAVASVPKGRPLTPDDYMSAQEDEIKQIIGEKSFRIIRENNILAVILSGKDVFSPQNQEISSDAAQTLKTMAGILARYDKTHISIIGYADSGNPSVDQENSEKRAQAVADTFKAAAPIADVRFWIEGSSQDAALSEEERMKNNHVDIILTPTFIR